MGWIQDTYKINLQKIKQKFQEIDSLFRGTETITVTNSPRRAKAFDDVLIHGNSFILERIDDREETGYYLLDGNNPNMRVGILTKGQIVGPDTTLYSMVELYSNGNIVPSGIIKDSSTSILVKKENIDNDSMGLLIAVCDEAGDGVAQDIPFLTISNGINITDEILSIYTNHIKLPKQGQQYSGNFVPAFLSYFDTDGKFFTGEALSGLATTAKTVVGAINELKTDISPNAGKQITSFELTSLDDTTDLALVPSPGADKYISLERIVLEYNLLTDFAENPDTYIGIGPEGSPNFNMDVEVPTQGGPLHTVYELTNTTDILNRPLSELVDKAITMKFSEIKTAGNLNIKVTVFYKIIDIQIIP